MRRLFIPLLILLSALPPAGAAQAARLTAQLDRNRVGEGDTVQLILEMPGQVSERPDTGPLQKDFEVLGVSTGSRVSIVNGHTDSRTTWTISLSPRHTGRLTIPPLQVGGSRSQPLTLEVSKAAIAAGDADILIESEVSPESPYVQAQVIYTLRLLYAVNISSGQLSEPKAENALIRKLGKDRNYTTHRHGRRYQVVERRYALFPQASGRLELAAPRFSGEIPDTRRRRRSPFDSFFGNDPFFGRDPFDDLLTPTRRVRAHGKPTVLQVRPRPDAARGAHWLPAQRLTLKGKWEPDGGQVQAGEPVTLVVDLQAKGLTGGQLPSLAPQKVEGFEVYPDQAERNTDSDDNGVVGSLHQKIAFIPQRSGRLTLPAISLSWWDIGADQQRSVSLPARIIQVAPASNRPASPPPPQTHNAPAPARSPRTLPGAAAAPAPGAPPASPWPATAGVWPWISAALASGWLATLLLWWWRARHRSRSRPASPEEPRTPSASAARKQFLTACKSGDPGRARQALLAWATAHWPANPPRGLEALADRLDDPRLKTELARLDRVIYRGERNWDGSWLASRLRHLPTTSGERQEERQGLPPLYPRTT